MTILTINFVTIAIIVFAQSICSLTLHIWHPTIPFDSFCLNLFTIVNSHIFVKLFVVLKVVSRLWLFIFQLFDICRLRYLTITLNISLKIKWINAKWNMGWFNVVRNQNIFQIYYSTRFSSRFTDLTFKILHSLLTVHIIVIINFTFWLDTLWFVRGIRD